MHPLTDIVVLTHNHRRITERCVEFLYKNTSNFNLIIVDNNSSDNTVSYLKAIKESNFTLIKNGTNRGVAGGRNDGIKASKAEYVICLDNDQYVNSGWLDSIFAILEKGFDSIGLDAWVLTPPNFRQRAYFPKKHCQTKFDKPTYVGGGGHLIPRKILEEFNFFDENYSPFFYEDSDLCFSMLKKGYRITWHYNNRVLHLGHQTGNKQRDFSLMDQFKKSYSYFVNKWYPYYPKPIDVLQLERILPEIFGAK
jgi:O-antigen biosynthesis protein